MLLIKEDYKVNMKQKLKYTEIIGIHVVYIKLDYYFETPSRFLNYLGKSSARSSLTIFALKNIRK